MSVSGSVSLVMCLKVDQLGGCFCIWNTGDKYSKGIDVLFGFVPTILTKANILPQSVFVRTVLPGIAKVTSWGYFPSAALAWRISVKVF